MLAAKEATPDEKHPLSEAIEQVLSDSWRSGRPDTFSAEQVVHLVAISCEEPSVSGLPINSWMPKGIVRSDTTRYCRANLTAKCGAFYKTRLICSRSGSSIG